MTEDSKIICDQIIDSVYNGMFSDDILILDKFEEFLDVASRWGCYPGWDPDNLFLLMNTFPNATDLRPEDRWQKKGISVAQDAQPIYFISDNGILDLYDISQTDAVSTAVSDIPRLDVETLLRIMYVIFSVFNRYLVTYLPHELYGMDRYNSWIKLGKTELGEKVLIFRKDPNDSEKQYSELTREPIDSDRCNYFKCRWMINCYLQAYYIGHYYDISLEDLDEKYEDLVYMGDVLADLIFHRFGVYEGHQIVNYPSIYNGKKRDINEFKEATADMLKCYQSLAPSIEKLADLYRQKITDR